MKKVRFERNGTIREWYDNNKKYHKEEIIDIFINNKKLPRGMCSVMFRRFMILKKGESKELILDEGNNALLLCETSGIFNTPCNKDHCNQGCA